MESIARIRVVNSVSSGDLWLWRKSRTSKKWSHAGGGGWDSWKVLGSGGVWVGSYYVLIAESFDLVLVAAHGHLSFD